jgi:hypothetical protein
MGRVALRLLFRIRMLSEKKIEREREKKKTKTYGEFT